MDKTSSIYLFNFFLINIFFLHLGSFNCVHCRNIRRRKNTKKRAVRRNLNEKNQHRSEQDRKNLKDDFFKDKRLKV